MKILCLGAGFTSKYLARAFSEEHAVAFLTREPAKTRDENLRAYIGEEFGRPDFILDTVPALFNGDSPEDPPYHEQVRAILNEAPHTPLIHISSTSVYPEGDRAASAAELPSYNEDTTPDPAGARGEKRLRWERHLRSFYPELRVLRSGGIYGPGRSLALRFREGDFRRADTGNRVVSRIHVRDLARLAIAMAKQSKEDARSMIIAVDKEPSPNRETFSFLEDLLGIRIPGTWREDEYQGRFMRSLFAEDLLGGEYSFPDFRAGFRHSLSGTP